MIFYRKQHSINQYNSERDIKVAKYVPGVRNMFATTSKGLVWSADSRPRHLVEGVFLLSSSRNENSSEMYCKDPVR